MRDIDGDGSATAPFDWRGERVCFTGAAGILGSWLVRRLVALMGRAEVDPENRTL